MHNFAFPKKTTNNLPRNGRRFGVAILAILMSGLVMPAHGQGTQQSAIMAAETARLDAQAARDTKTVAGLLAPTATYIHANGAVQAKDDFLADLEAGKIRHRDIVLTDRAVELRGDVGITHGTIELTVGADRRISGRYTGVYAQEGGMWKLLSWQTTPIQPRTPEPTGTPR